MLMRTDGEYLSFLIVISMSLAAIDMAVLLSKVCAYAQSW